LQHTWRTYRRTKCTSAPLLRAEARRDERP
jgi:hypothetical protein